MHLVSQSPTRPKLILSNMTPLSLMLALILLLGTAAAYNMSQWSTGRATHSGGEIRLQG